VCASAMPEPNPNIRIESAVREIRDAMCCSIALARRDNRAF
jgi:hypothetical protein